MIVTQQERMIANEYRQFGVPKRWRVDGGPDGSGLAMQAIRSAIQGRLPTWTTVRLFLSVDGRLQLWQIDVEKSQLIEDFGELAQKPRGKPLARPVKS